MRKITFEEAKTLPYFIYNGNYVCIKVNWTDKDLHELRKKAYIAIGLAFYPNFNYLEYSLSGHGLSLRTFNNERKTYYFEEGYRYQAFEDYEELLSLEIHSQLFRRLVEENKSNFHKIEKRILRIKMK